MKTKKSYTQMNLEELRTATKEFDKPWTGTGAARQTAYGR